MNVTYTRLHTSKRGRGQRRNKRVKNGSLSYKQRLYARYVMKSFQRRWWPSMLSKKQLAWTAVFNVAWSDVNFFDGTYSISLAS